MSRSTKTLRRLGVGALATVTMGAGLPVLFASTAQAAPIGTLTVNAPATAAAGVCELVEITSTPATAGQSTVGEIVNVILTDAAGTGAAFNSSNPEFCTTATGDTTPATGTVVSTQGAQSGGGGVDQSRFTLVANSAAPNNGRVFIGVRNFTPGNAVTIRAFSDTNNNNSFDAAAGEPTGTDTLTFSAGGPAGSNANQTAANFVEVLTGADTTAANADTDSAIEGEQRTFRVFVSNGTAAGDRLAGVTVSASVAGAAAAQDQAVRVFGVTNNDGIVTGTITFPERTATPGTDTVTFFVNEGGAPGLDGTESSDTVAVTVSDNADQANTTVTLTPENANTPVTGTAGAGRADATTNFTARTNDPRTTGGTNTAGTRLSFTVTGGNGNEVLTTNATAAGDRPNECTTVDDAGSPAANDATCVLTVTDPDPQVGQVLTVAVNVRSTTQSDTSTLTYTNVATDARNISIAPVSATTTPNTARTFTATAVDAQGNPVANVEVRFTETGTGAFRNGSSQIDVTTNAQGQATVETISLPGETGAQTITATIIGTRNAAGTFVARGAGATDDQCEQAVGQGTNPNSSAVGANQTAGNCSAQATNNFSTVTASPSPSATATASGTPTATATATVSPSVSPTNPTPSPTVACGNVVTRVNTPTIVVGQRGSVTVSGARANTIIELYAYSRPSTEFRLVRSAEAGADGSASFDNITPPTNTRLFGLQRGCPRPTNNAGSVVINVRTALGLSARRLGVRQYLFEGRLLPRNQATLVSLYRIDRNGREILSGQDASDAGNSGLYQIRRTFTGSGRFDFVARTSQTLINAPGVSNVRPTIIF